ncbi:unnamed protein product [Heterobilharzia americana]|nr:unnamed protein product [Heterobilharzia americana]
MRRTEKKNMESKPCENNARNFSVVYFDHAKQKFSQRIMSYTDRLCIQLLSQSATMEECHCIDFLMPIPGAHMDLVNQLPFCGNLSRAHVNDSLVCSQQVRQRNSKHFRQLCPTPCVQMQYNYELTQLRWPQKPRILNYYAQLKDRIDYNRKFEIYERIEEISMTNATKALTMLQHTDVFEKNFLQVDVSRPNFDTLMSYQENEEYTLPTLLSQIGGICSIFLSFTCVTVLELIELMFRLILIACPRFLSFTRHALHYLNMKTFKFGFHTANNKKSSFVSSLEQNRKLSAPVSVRNQKEEFSNDLSWYAKNYIKNKFSHNEMNYVEENLLSTYINKSSDINTEKNKFRVYRSVGIANCQMDSRFRQLHEPGNKCFLHSPILHHFNSDHPNTTDITHLYNDSFDISHNSDLSKRDDIILHNIGNQNNESTNNGLPNSLIGYNFNNGRNSSKLIARSISFPDFINHYDIVKK